MEEQFSFQRIRLVNNPSVEAYVQELMSTSHKLASVGFELDNSWMLLTGLPEHYYPMIMDLEVSGITLTAEAVKSKILQDAKIERGETSFSDKEALYSRTRNGANQRPKIDEKTCFNFNNSNRSRARSLFDSRHESRGRQWMVPQLGCHLPYGTPGLDNNIGTANNTDIKAVALFWTAAKVESMSAVYGRSRILPPSCCPWVPSAHLFSPRTSLRSWWRSDYHQRRRTAGGVISGKWYRALACTFWTSSERSGVKIEVNSLLDLFFCWRKRWGGFICTFDPLLPVRQ